MHHCGTTQDDGHYRLCVNDKSEGWFCLDPGANSSPATIQTMKSAEVMTSERTSHAIYVRTLFTPFSPRTSDVGMEVDCDFHPTQTTCTSVDDLPEIEPMIRDNISEAILARSRLAAEIERHPDGHSSQNEPQVIRRDGSKYSLRTITKLWSATAGKVTPAQFRGKEHTTTLERSSPHAAVEEATRDQTATGAVLAQIEASPKRSSSPLVEQVACDSPQRDTPPAPTALTSASHAQSLPTDPAEEDTACSPAANVQTPTSQIQSSPSQLDVRRVMSTPNKGQKRTRNAAEDEHTYEIICAREPVIRMQKRGAFAHPDSESPAPALDDAAHPQCRRRRGECTCPRCHPSPPAKTHVMASVTAPAPTITTHISSGLKGTGGQKSHNGNCGHADRSKPHLSNNHLKTSQAVKSCDDNSYISSPCSAPCWRLLFCNLPSGLCDMTSRNVARDTASPSGEHSGRGCLTACSSGPCSFTVPMCCNGVGYFSCKQKKRQGVHIDFPKQLSSSIYRFSQTNIISEPH